MEVFEGAAGAAEDAVHRPARLHLSTSLYARIYIYIYEQQPAHNTARLLAVPPLYRTMSPFTYDMLCVQCRGWAALGGLSVFLSVSKDSVCSVWSRGV